MATLHPEHRPVPARPTTAIIPDALRTRGIARVPAIPGAVSDAQLQQWADNVTRRYRTVVANVVAIGHELTGIKAQCPHGSFERMFAGHPQAVATPIPFSIRTGEMFMAVAKHPILSKAHPGAFLPTSWRVLYELTRLPPAVLTQALKEGQIYPEMQRQDVQRLHPPRARSGRLPPPPFRAGRMPPAPPRSTAGAQAQAQRNAQRAIANGLQRLWQRYPEEHAFFLRQVETLRRAAGRPIPWDDPWPPGDADQETETA